MSGSQRDRPDKTDSDQPDGPGSQEVVTTGIAYTNTNLLTGKSITVDPRGSAMHTTVKDGVATVISNGQTGLIMFPTDVPAGPSTTVYRGRVVFTIDLTTGVFTLVGTTGTSITSAPPWLSWRYGA